MQSSVSLRRLDGLMTLVHNASRMSYGFAEGSIPEQISQILEIHVIGTPRLNRAALTYMRHDAKAGEN
jgi:hypothetical protein